MKVFCKSFGGGRRQWQTRLEFPSPLLVPLKRRAILKMSLRDKGMEA